MFLTDGPASRSYDCYVIGAGPAGITLSLELAKSNRTVLLFETGTVTERRRDMPNTVSYGHFGRGWWDAHSTRMLGGTSSVWEGWCATLMDLDFDNPAAGVSVADHQVGPCFVLSARRGRRGPPNFHPRLRDATGTGIQPRTFQARHESLRTCRASLGTCARNA